MSVSSINKSAVMSLVVIVALFQAMGGLMGWITAQGVDGWYQNLVRSPLNPPDYLFGIVWTGLYFLLSVAFWVLWRAPKSPQRTKVMALFIGHMILNWLWSPVFFTAHLTGPAFFLIVILFLTAALLGWLFFQKINRRAAMVFIPYMAWLAFAGHLSHYIWANN